MSLTMSTVSELRDYDGSISDCALKSADVVLRSARGNSGAILSLFFRGMAKSLSGLDEADSSDIAMAFEYGTKEAYKAVMNPTEGTILTIMRMCAEKAVIACKSEYKGDVVGLFKFLVAVAENALSETPELLPILKQANVVDAGGYGFVTVLKGMLAALMNNSIVCVEHHDDKPNAADFSSFSTADVKFAYCTEFILEKSEKFKGENTARGIYDFIIGIGDSAVFIDDELIVKVHVHTNNPGAVLEKALEYGSLATVKIENMKLQHSAKVLDEGKINVDITENHTLRAVKKYGIVAVCMGDGICDTFRDLGADSIVHGGQTMNPSTQDIINAVNLTPAENVFVLPNNKNIALVAKQAAELITDKKVVVIPTRNIPQGISAMLSFDAEADLAVNTDAMEASLAGVLCMSVTHAVRDSQIEGISIENGQMLGLADEKIVCTADDIRACAEKLAERCTDKTYISLFSGEGVSEDEEREVHEIFASHVGNDCEIVMIHGNQPVYDFIISAE